MKFFMKYFLIAILLFIGIIGCSKNKFEVNSIDDKNYLSIYDNVDELPIVIIPDSNKVYDEIKNKFQQFVMDSSWQKSFSTWISNFSENYYPEIPRFELMCRVYLNDRGGIDKINFIIDPNQKFKGFILNEIKKWEFIPAKNNGKNVNFQFDWMITSPPINITSSLSPKNFPLSRITVLRFINSRMKQPDKMPEPIGGIKAIQKKIHYPEIAKRAGIEGKVFIRADIDKEGNVTKTEVLKKLGHGLDEAAVKAVSQTKFKPAKKNNKEVEAQVVIPILFKLDSSNSGK